jgi:hypothetical protein
VSTEPKRFWVEGRGWVSVDDASSYDLAASRDSEWMFGRPAGVVPRWNLRSQEPEIKAGVDLATLERAVIADTWIGPMQRSGMLKELRALNAYFASRFEPEPLRAPRTACEPLMQVEIESLGCMVSVGQG